MILLPLATIDILWISSTKYRSCFAAKFAPHQFVDSFLIRTVVAGPKYHALHLIEEVTYVIVGYVASDALQTFAGLNLHHLHSDLVVPNHMLLFQQGIEIANAPEQHESVTTTFSGFPVGSEVDFFDFAVSLKVL